MTCANPDLREGNYMKGVPPCQISSPLLVNGVRGGAFAAPPISFYDAVTSMGGGISYLADVDTYELRAICGAHSSLLGWHRTQCTRGVQTAHEKELVRFVSEQLCCLLFVHTDRVASFPRRLQIVDFSTQRIASVTIYEHDSSGIKQAMINVVVWELSHPNMVYPLHGSLDEEHTTAVLFTDMKLLPSHVEVYDPSGIPEFSQL